MALRWYRDGIQREYDMRMVCRWYSEGRWSVDGTVRRKLFLKTKNFVSHADGDALFASPGPGPGVRSRVEMIYKFFFFFRKKIFLLKSF